MIEDGCKKNWIGNESMIDGNFAISLTYKLYHHDHEFHYTVEFSA